MPGFTDDRAIARIRALAGLGASGADHHHAHGDAEADGDVFAPGCTIRSLPDRLQVDAAGLAAAVNPVNLPPRLGRMASLVPDHPLSLTLMVSKYFGPAARTFTVSFLETTPASLRNRIIAHMNAWTDCCSISFRYTAGTGQVRISRAGSGYWSYLGTDVLLIPKAQPTMNLQGFAMATPESEYRRVVRHETGHTLGFPHEHMRKELVDRIDPTKAYDYFGRTQGWSHADVDQQVLTPLDQANTMGTPADQSSIMCYQLPGSIMKDGSPILGGVDINPTDCGFARKVYPKPPKPAPAPKPAAAPAGKATGRGATFAMATPTGGFADHPRDWSLSDDVDVEAAIAEARATAR